MGHLICTRQVKKIQSLGPHSCGVQPRLPIRVYFKSQLKPVAHSQTHAEQQEQQQVWAQAGIYVKEDI